VEQLWELIQQFENLVEYAVKHHVDLSCDTLNFVLGFTKQEILQRYPTWSRCGFGKIPAVTIGRNIYPCFRMLPGSNQLKNAQKYTQGNVNTSIIEHKDILRQLNDNSAVAKMKIKDECEKCSIFTICPYCAADCVNKDEPTL
jgi:radical SAM protein with 4Fe4S-binding SPASM domain